MASVTFDTGNFDKSISSLLSKGDDLADKAIKEIADDALSAAEKYVPFDIGTLNNSGVVEPIGAMHYRVGYHTVYAARLHEGDGFNFQKGNHPAARAHFLKDAIEESIPAFEASLRDIMQNGLRGILR